MAVAKITEIQSSSSKSFEHAINAGIARAEKTLRNLTGAWIKSQKVVIEKGKITEYRVLLKVTFVLTISGQARLGRASLRDAKADFRDQVRAHRRAATVCRISIAFERLVERLGQIEP
jgi:flavin-binding protein dodecin